VTGGFRISMNLPISEVMNASQAPATSHPGMSSFRAMLALREFVRGNLNLASAMEVAEMGEGHFIDLLARTQERVQALAAWLQVDPDLLLAGGVPHPEDQDMDLLELEGYEVDEADSCRRAQERFRASRPDVVVRNARIFTCASPSTFAIWASIPGRFSWDTVNCFARAIPLLQSSELWPPRS